MCVKKKKKKWKQRTGQMQSRVRTNVVVMAVCSEIVQLFCSEMSALDRPQISGTTTAAPGDIPPGQRLHLMCFTKKGGLV